MKIPAPIVDFAKRSVFLRNVAYAAYGLYWKYRTRRDLARIYGKSPRFVGAVEGFRVPTLEAIESQLCTAAQCLEPRYRFWCDEMRSPARLGRKQWEFVYIFEALSQKGKLTKNQKGLGFGCGREPLPAIFAKYGCTVVATDLKTEEAQIKGWVHTEQHASTLQGLNSQRLCDPTLFDDQVSFEFADMNQISESHFGKFDFVWSACALEHLGSIQHGLDFVIHSMDCLKPGGVAVHTTEFNLSSDTDTLEDPGCVLFRRQDMLKLQGELEMLGYIVSPYNFNPGQDPVDTHIDAPPYAASPHLKLQLGRYVTTSIGLIVQKPSCAPSSLQN